MTYRLHYAPDNASLCVRLMLLELGQPFETVLVDRQRQGQQSPSYLALNPNGQIPVLETPDGPVFETAAILLWLADRHGALAPGPGGGARGAFLKWLFNLSNTLHPMLRIMFYPEKHIAPEGQATLVETTQHRITTHLDMLDTALPREPVWQAPSALHLYLCPMLRWLALYPTHQPGWLNPSRWPNLHALAARIERRASVVEASIAEGLGPTPFTAPRPPNPPEGSAL